MADDVVEISYGAQVGVCSPVPAVQGRYAFARSHDVMNARPNELFAACFTKWVTALRDDEIVAIDGKTSRAWPTGRPFLVSVSAARQRLGGR